MTVSHLMNAARMMERKARESMQEADACAAYSGNGEMAQMYAEHGMDQAFDGSLRYQGVARLLKDYAKGREKHFRPLTGP